MRILTCLPLVAPRDAVNICAPGSGGAACVPCSRGMFSAGGNAQAPQPACMRCPPGTNTNGTRATSSANCSTGESEAFGLWIVFGWCATMMERNTHATCQSDLHLFCPPPPHPTHIIPTVHQPAVAIPVCGPGTGGVGCHPCNFASWSGGGNATVQQPVCQPCPPGTITTSLGATSSASCIVPGALASMGGQLAVDCQALSPVAPKDMQYDLMTRVAACGMNSIGGGKDLVKAGGIAD